jgi:hypothetical protein
MVPPKTENAYLGSLHVKLECDVMCMIRSIIYYCFVDFLRPTQAVARIPKLPVPSIIPR